MPSNLKVIGVSASLTGLFLAAALNANSVPESDLVFASIEDLGEALFFDVNLSKNRTQSCATCHDPAHGLLMPDLMLLTVPIPWAMMAIHWGIVMHQRRLMQCFRRGFIKTIKVIMSGASFYMEARLIWQVRLVGHL